MDIKIKKLQRKDYDKVINFATEGMHFQNFIGNNKTLLYLYSKCFLYEEMLEATQILAAYNKKEVLGILIANMKGRKKRYYSLGKKIYVKIGLFIQNTFFKSNAAQFDIACEEMLEEYKKNNNPDGEIAYLAVDPNLVGQGVGTKLLEAFEKDKSGKLIFLYTDDLCTYQFYDKRGFTRPVEKDIVLHSLSAHKPMDVKCMLYNKVIK